VATGGVDHYVQLSCWGRLPTSSPQRADDQDIDETRPPYPNLRRCLDTHTDLVDQLLPTLIAFGSLLVAALTVVVSYLNAGRQAEAATELEHAKWLREKRDMVYGRLLSTLASPEWWQQPMPYEERRKDASEVVNLAMRYASDDVLAEAQVLHGRVKELEGREKFEVWSPRGPENIQATSNLVRSVRAELAGAREAERTWERYAREHGSRTLRRSKPPGRAVT
jgi:hypothetical protein